MARTDRELLSLEKLAGIPPVLPIINDHPLDMKTKGQDKFELCYRLGPVFDIIRHADTAMPTTIAIYGDWGAGKTSAMRWLEALIKERTKQSGGPEKTRIHPVWFYPWKYHDKEDVWRGLIAEVILASIDVKGADLPRVEEAARQFGLFLGRSFLHVLSAVNKEAASAIRNVIDEFKQIDHPEKAYLNEFETSLREWTEKTLGKNDRMVIFIDDLDRCMPEIALQVLESLKLYLNIKKLIFVVGVDREVIEPLVKKHYENLGLEDYKSENYLAKMFQTEVAVGPSEKQINNYLDEQFEKIDYFKGGYLDIDDKNEKKEEKEKELFKDLIKEFAYRNPREVKRLINSAVMAGAGAEMLKRAGEEKPAFSFKQGLQVFFIRKIVENPKTYNMPRLVGSNFGNDFFAEWSKIVCENRKDNPDFSYYIPSIKDYLREVQQTEDDVSKGKIEPECDLEPPRYIPKPYHELIQTSRFRNLLPLLGDKDLGRLMQIEFSSEIAEISQKVESQQSDEEVIRKAVAEQRRKTVRELQAEDYTRVKQLDLTGRGIADLNPLKWLPNLAELNLSGNKVKDTGPLKDLRNLVKLDLRGNRITDLSPLRNLPNLTELDLRENQISDVSPLAWRKNLTELFLGENQIGDIGPLEGLENIEVLDLWKNNVIDISSLKDLRKLRELDLGGNPITDIGPLKEVTNLTWLKFKKNKIIDISPLTEMTNLTWLDLAENPVDDLAALTHLGKLEYLDIKECRKITDEQVAKLQKALPNLRIER